MKKTAIAILLVLTLAFSLCACGSKEKVKEYNSKEDFAELGLSLNAPQGAEGQKYAVVESSANGEDINIAQISYTYNDISCILRSANVAEHNISGFDENKAQSEEQYDLNIEGFSSQIRIMQIDGKYVAIWTLGDYSYSLCAETEDTLAATSCAMDAANANVPATGAPTTQAAQSNPSEQSPAAQTSQAAY